ncbi:DUF4244 domain-containing protein [Trujillonella endophytica]|uniref:DUF4244 domain-containing protein n=1 Tax=Trujillonella endophytica TaxID=673521 RepID=A0A1H8WLD3_9ACTN|nr:DUF4244 domain-containing protein [Trujillella endophytica]SEP27898.1 Protein of unknown function [Trujillella endophytica]
MTEQHQATAPERAGDGGAADRPAAERLADRWARLVDEPEAGMSTAEYAVGTIAACAFAAVLYKVVTGGSIVTALGDLVASALSTLG